MFVRRERGKDEVFCFDTHVVSYYSTVDVWFYWVWCCKELKVLVSPRTGSYTGCTQFPLPATTASPLENGSSSFYPSPNQEQIEPAREDITLYTLPHGLNVLLSQHT